MLADQGASRANCGLRQPLAAKHPLRLHLARPQVTGDDGLGGGPVVGVVRLREDSLAVRREDGAGLAHQLAATIVGFHGCFSSLWVIWDSVRPSCKYTWENRA